MESTTVEARRTLPGDTKVVIKATTSPTAPTHIAWAAAAATRPPTRTNANTRRLSAHTLWGASGQSGPMEVINVHKLHGAES